MLSLFRRDPGWVVGLIAFFTWAGPARGAAPRFETPEVTGGQVTLRLLGEPGTTYRIEGSTNLVAWFPVGTGPATAGVLTIRHDGPGSRPWLYYRGVQDGAVAPSPTVTWGTSSNLIGGVLLDSEHGGELRLDSPGRVVYRLVYPTNAVVDPVQIRLTVLTNVVGVPARDGFLAGVRLEPDGFVLAAPLWLEMEFPAAIPVAQVSSYGFDGDGARLNLVPDIVLTNRVRILVSQLRSYACGKFTLDELEALAATAAPPRVRAAKPALHASIEECFPDEEDEARVMNEDLADGLRPYQQEAARQLGSERQRQLLGGADEGASTALLEQVMADGVTFFRNELKTRIPQALKKCALARALIPWVLGFERQRQLLGMVPEGEGMDPAVTDLLCGSMKRCQEQAVECCQQRGGDTRLISFLLGIERQRQLLGISNGGGCGDPLDVADVVDKCAPKWFGTLEISTSGGYTTNRSGSPETILRESVSYQFLLEARVVSVEIVTSPAILFLPAFTNLTFRMQGTLIGERTRSIHDEDLYDGCSSGSSRALASRGLHDGGSSILRDAVTTCRTNVPVDFQVTARIMAPGAGGFGITPYLQFAVPLHVARIRGWKVEVERAETSTGCEIDDRSGPISDELGFGGQSFYRERGEFAYTADAIEFLRITPVSIGLVSIDETLRLKLRRVK